VKVGDRQAALFALAATRPKVADPVQPPSDEELAALIEHRLAPGRRAAVLAYLDSHPEAYREWLALAAALISQDNPDESLSPWRKPPWRSIAAAAAVALLVLVLDRSGPPDIADLIQEGFLAIEKVPGSGVGDLVAKGYGFSGPSEHVGALSALSKGYWDGFQRIDRGEVASQAVAAVNQPAYQFGQWLLLVEMACAGPHAQEFPPAFWNRQRIVGESLVVKLADGADASSLQQVISDDAPRLLQQFEVRVAEIGGERWCQQVSDRLRAIRLRLGLISP
jgi:hypothetical protein